MRGGTQSGEPGCDRLGSDAEAAVRQSHECSDTGYCPAAVDDGAAAVAGREIRVVLEHDAVAVEPGRELGKRDMFRHQPRLTDGVPVTPAGNPTAATLAETAGLAAARRSGRTEDDGCARSSARSYPGRLPSTAAERCAPPRTSSTRVAFSTT